MSEMSPAMADNDDREKKRCHFGIVSYSWLQSLNPEIRNQNTDLIAAKGLHWDGVKSE